jgi:hypothetical protein
MDPRSRFLIRSDRDLDKIPKDAGTEDIINITNKALGYVEFLNKNISLRSNFNCYVAENVVLAAGTTVKIQHFLGVVPKWRIILRQTGNGVITDVNDSPSDWNDKIISLKNNGAVEVVLSVWIGRE